MYRVYYSQCDIARDFIRSTRREILPAILALTVFSRTSSSQGIRGIVAHFSSGRLRYKSATVVNLREDLSVEGDDLAFGPRDVDCLSRPINMPGITAEEIEVSGLRR